MRNEQKRNEEVTKRTEDSGQLAGGSRQDGEPRDEVINAECGMRNEEEVGRGGDEENRRQRATV